MADTDEKISLPLFRWEPEDEADLRRPSPKKKPSPKVPGVNNLPHRLVNHDYMRVLEISEERNRKKTQTPEPITSQQKPRRSCKYSQGETIPTENLRSGKRKTRIVSTLTSSGDYCLSL